MTRLRSPDSSRLPRIALLVLPLLAGGCGTGSSPAEERIARAERGKGDVVIAVAWPWAARTEVRYAEGLDLAVDEINASGGVNGRKLRLLREDDGESVNEGLLVAQRIAENPEVSAVIGHLQSYITVPAAAVYDLSGVVMLAPASTAPELTGQGYARVFRSTFTDHETGHQMAEFAAQRGYRRVAIYYARNSYGRALANAFEERAAGVDLHVVARASYASGADVDGRMLEPMLREWKQMELDAVFLAGEVPLAGQIIALMRRAGVEVPILGGDAMSSPALITSGGRAAEGTVVSSFFHASEPRTEVQRFTAAFERRYGLQPDVGSAIGYDAVHLLAHAMRSAGSTAPDPIARALRDVRDWQGVTGPVTFGPNGDLLSRRIVKLVVKDGAFEYLPDAPSGLPADR
jgi:branched-chain amino acid transport system substrate-binding protein